MLEAADGVEQNGNDYSVAEGYSLCVYVGQPGQAMEVSEVGALRLDTAFCEATSREHNSVYFLGVQQLTRALRSAAGGQRWSSRWFQLRRASLVAAGRF